MVQLMFVYRGPSHNYANWCPWQGLLHVMIPPSGLSDEHHSLLVCSVMLKILKGYCFKGKGNVLPLVLVYRGPSPNSGKLVSWAGWSVACCDPTK